MFLLGRDDEVLEKLEVTMEQAANDQEVSWLSGMGTSNVVSATVAVQFGTLPVLRTPVREPRGITRACCGDCTPGMPKGWVAFATQPFAYLVVELLLRHVSSCGTVRSIPASCE